MAGVSGGIALASGLAGAIGGAGGGGGGGGMPRWQRRAMRDNYGRAQDVAGQMRVAPFNADQRQAFRGVRNFQGYLDGDMAGAQARAEDLAGGVTHRDIRQFYNPFENDVVGSFLNDVNTMHGTEDLRVNDAAEGASAFGGDREAVYRAVSQGVVDDNAQRNLAGIRSRGYELASNNAMTNHGLQLAGNQQLQGLIESRRGNRLEELRALLASGGMQQDQLQRQYNLPVDRLNLLMQSVGQPMYNPPSQPYDPVAGALSGFQGGYGTGADIAGLLGRVMGNSRSSIAPNYGAPGVSAPDPSSWMPNVPQISPYDGVYTNPYPG